MDRGHAATHFNPKICSSQSGRTGIGSPTSLKHKGNEGHYTEMEEESKSMDEMETIKQGAKKRAADRNNKTGYSLNGRG